MAVRQESDDTSLRFPCVGCADDGGAGRRYFLEDIAPIFQRACQSCHRPGSIAPMSLITYQEARPWRGRFRKRCSKGRCRRGTSIGTSHQQVQGRPVAGPTRNCNHIGWVEHGAPEALRPTCSTASVHRLGKWHMGNPDIVVSMSSLICCGRRAAMSTTMWTSTRGSPKTFTSRRWRRTGLGLQGCPPLHDESDRGSGGRPGWSLPERIRCGEERGHFFRIIPAV